MSSYETAVVRVQQVAAKLAPQMLIKVQPPYGDSPDYIAALTASAANYLEAGYDICCSVFTGCRNGISKNRSHGPSLSDGPQLL
jgi:protoheme ferro-lyase